MTRHSPSNRRPDHSSGWFRAIIGNAMLTFAGGLAVLFIMCMLFVDSVPWWISVPGLVVSGGIAWWGDSLRTRKIYVDPETGRVKKNNL